MMIFSNLMSAQNVEFLISKENNELSLHLNEYNNSRLLESLLRGFQSEIVFELKQYKESKGFFHFLGDNLIKEEKIIYTAKFDVFKNSFIISQKDQQFIYETASEFAVKFTSLENYKFNMIKDKNENYYIIGRIQIRFIKFRPPFNILSPFLTHISYKLLFLAFPQK